MPLAVLFLLYFCFAPLNLCLLGIPHTISLSLIFYHFIKEFEPPQNAMFDQLHHPTLFLTYHISCKPFHYTLYPFFLLYMYLSSKSFKQPVFQISCFHSTPMFHLHMLLIVHIIIPSHSPQFTSILNDLCFLLCTPVPPPSFSVRPNFIFLWAVKINHFCSFQTHSLYFCLLLHPPSAFYIHSNTFASVCKSLSFCKQDHIICKNYIQHLFCILQLVSLQLIQPLLLFFLSHLPYMLTNYRNAMHRCLTSCIPKLSLISLITLMHASASFHE